MQIGSNGSQQNQSPIYNNNLYSHTFQQQSYQEKTGSISITTDEGDVVTFNQSSLVASEINSATFGNQLAQGMTFSATAIRAESMSFTVEGDLNEQELADIADLYDTLTTIASDFFNGDYGKAMEGALGIGDLGSLASLDASFTHTQITATQITSQHVIPADSDKFVNAFKDMTLPANDPKERDLLSARWRQITSFIDQQTKDLQKESLEKERFTSHPEQMMQEIAATIDRHPRLSPYAIPLADKAVQETAGQSSASPVQNMHQKQFFKNDFLKQFHNWLEA